MKFFYSILFVMITASSVAEVSLPSIFSDNMVIQRNSSVKIWGWAKPGEEVRIHNTWNENIASTKADKNATWEIILDTPDIRGKQAITIKGYNEIVINNVLLGEVWLVSGQSNMEWTAAAGIDNAEEAIARANHPDIRFFQVLHHTANYPQQDLQGSWVPSSPETMKYFSAVAYFFGKKLKEELDVPVGLVNASWGGTPAEVWMPAEVFKVDKELQKAASLLPEEQWGPNLPGKIYNAMIAPLIPFKFSGILWYQGESNTGTANYYQKVFSTLIQSWRSNWQEEMPFLYAQIAPYNYGEGEGGVKVRDAQRRVLELPKTGMVVTSDIGNINDIHPQNKLDVGLRFANLALSMVYDKDIQSSSPLFKNIQIDNNTVTVNFENAEGLRIDKSNPDSQFEIAGEDKIFYPAKLEIKGDTVRLKTSKVKDPEYIRFAWGNTATSNLFNEAGLPASSFTTEY